jgi:hypothetical protein
MTRLSKFKNDGKIPLLQAKLKKQKKTIKLDKEIKNKNKNNIV